MEIIDSLEEFSRPRDELLLRPDLLAGARRSDSSYIVESSTRRRVLETAVLVQRVIYHAAELSLGTYCGKSV
jgi:hypothetical protein